MERRALNDVFNLPECYHIITQEEALRVRNLVLKLTINSIDITEEFWENRTIGYAAYQIWGHNPKGIIILLHAIWPERFDLLMEPEN